MALKSDIEIWQVSTRKLELHRQENEKEIDSLKQRFMKVYYLQRMRIDV